MPLAKSRRFKVGARLPWRWAAFLTTSVSCVGAVGSGPDGTGMPPGGKDVTPPLSDLAPLVQQTAMRRLTKNELRNTIRDLLSGDSAAGAAVANLDRWPEESQPFDNDYTQQFASSRLIDTAKTIAEDVARAVLGSPALLQKVTGCMPGSAANAPCLNEFIGSFGKRALRRPPGADEVGQLAALVSQEADLGTQVGMVIRTLLQDPEFIFRIERGTPAGAPELVRLTSWEMASRLSYLLWGSMPNGVLFDLAARDQLKSPSQIAKAAGSMLDGTLGGAAARDRANRFHAMWLGYDGVVGAAGIGLKLRAEANAMLERVIFQERSSWLDLFKLKETFIDDALAEYYGDVPKPGTATATWAPYGTSQRQGILSLGAFLSVANGPGDTSVTLRGKNIRNKLLCQEIPPPPPKLMQDNKPVDTTKPPTPGPNECRIDAIMRTTLRPGSTCVMCHSQMDSIGLSLENYDRGGRYRKTDDNKPKCIIKGEGQLRVEEAGAPVLKTFHGPADLSALLLESEQDRLGRCLVSQYMRFASGRTLLDEEAALVDSMSKRFGASGLSFQDLLLAYVSSPGFGYRRLSE